jgi:pyridoxine 4-dehydrogenase
VLGYGAVSLSCGNRPGETEAEALLEEVLGAGITLLDTADTYCSGPNDLHHGERLISRVLGKVKPRDCPVIVATKGGTVRTEQGWELDSSPERIYAGIKASYIALGGREPIPLWQHHWPDPRYSIGVVMRQVRRAVDEGLIRHVGVGNYSLAQLRQAREQIEVISVQNQLNFWHREAERDGLLEYCEREGLLFLPWRPLGGAGLAEQLGEIEPLGRIARERGVSVKQVAIAWVMARSPCVLPIPGSCNLRHVRELLAAAELRLEAAEVALLDALGPDEIPRRDRPPAWEQSPPLKRQ